jgi:hypothetical protein
METGEREIERKRERLSHSLPPVIHTEIHRKMGGLLLG